MPLILKSILRIFLLLLVLLGIAAYLFRYDVEKVAYALGDKVGIDVKTMVADYKLRKNQDPTLINQSLLVKDAKHLFADTAFYDCLMERYRTELLKKIKYISCEQRGITSLKGIENLIMLHSLKLKNNNLKELKLNNLQLLGSVDLSNNDIESIELQNNKRLAYLNLSHNKIHTADFGQHQFDHLDLSHNQLTEIPNDSADYLKLSNNKITDIKEIDFTRFNTLEIRHNQIKNIGFMNKAGLTDPNNLKQKLSNIPIISRNHSKRDQQIKNRSAGKLIKINHNPITINHKDQLEILQQADVKVAALNPESAHFPDDNLRSCLEDMPVIYPQKLKSIDCGFESAWYLKDRKISSTIGLNTFPQLETLDLSHHALQTINLDNLKNLTSINLSNNQLNEINFAQGNRINHLNLSNNQLKHINLAQLPQLNYLNILGNQFSALDFSLAENIETLVLEPSRFKTQDRQKILAMTTDKSSPELDAVIDEQLQQCVASSLLREGVSLSQLTKLMCLNNDSVKNTQGIERLTALTRLTLTEVEAPINFSHFKALHKLNIYRSNLSDVELTHNKQLRQLTLKEIVADKIILPVLEKSQSDWEITHNKLMSNLDTFSDVSYDIQNSAIQRLLLPDNCHFNKLTVYRSQLEDINIGQNCVIRELHLSANLLSDLDTTGINELRQIKINVNQLKSLDLSHLDELTHIDIQDNQISLLKINPKIQLKYLNISLNPIKFSALKLEQLPNELFVSTDQIELKNKLKLFKRYQVEEIDGFIRFKLKK